MWIIWTQLFQSTHSLRSATVQGCRMPYRFCVSIHALLAECDVRKATCPRDNELFQSTHSLRSATSNRDRFHRGQSVSIHALLAECDEKRICNGNGVTSFNPRTPCGVRHVAGVPGAPLERFQSTHSLRSATFPAIRGHSDGSSFNPRTPCGVRLYKVLYVYHH